jgi:hypothetical protein
MVWRTINGKRRYISENPERHEAREDKAIKKLESDIARLRNPNTAMNPIASASIIKAMQSEISGLKSINNMQDKKLRQKTRKEWFNDHKELNY